MFVLLCNIQLYKTIVRFHSKDRSGFTMKAYERLKIHIGTVFAPKSH